MSEKTPIKVNDIRKGDLIRIEWADRSAAEHVAKDDRDIDKRVLEGDEQVYLIERPAPALPEEPTLGWLTVSQCSGDRVEVGVPVLARWSAPGPVASSILRDGDTCGVMPAWVTKFDPAVPVPRSAIDALEFARQRIALSGDRARSRAGDYSGLIGEFVRAHTA